MPPPLYSSKILLLVGDSNIGTIIDVLEITNPTANLPNPAIVAEFVNEARARENIRHKLIEEARAITTDRAPWVETYKELKARREE
ncbi:hypothetical protein MMC28_010368 [Mycoblastus sanguinarius]|nr:hypothetical protein [Mycoblastus sanguinarius]